MLIVLLLHRCSVAYVVFACGVQMPTAACVFDLDRYDPPPVASNALDLDELKTPWRMPIEEVEHVGTRREALRRALPASVSELTFEMCMHAVRRVRVLRWLLLCRVRADR